MSRFQQFLPDTDVGLLVKNQINGGRESVTGQPIAWSETGDEYVAFYNVGLSLEQVASNLVAEVKSYLAGHFGKIYWRRDPEFESKDHYGGEKDLMDHWGIPPVTIWYGSCRLVASDKEPQELFLMKSYP